MWSSLSASVIWRRHGLSHKHVPLQWIEIRPDELWECKVENCCLENAVIPICIIFCRYYADIVDGNLKAVMRMILALAAHFKPSANHRTAAGSGRSSSRVTTNHNPHSTVALVQGAAAALVTARHDAAQPTRHTHLRRYTSIHALMQMYSLTVWKQY